MRVRSNFFLIKSIVYLLFLGSKESISGIFHYSSEKYNLDKIRKKYNNKLAMKYLKNKKMLESESNKSRILANSEGFTVRIRKHMSNKKLTKIRNELIDIDEYRININNISIKNNSINGKIYSDLEKGERISENIPFSNSDIIILSSSVLISFIFLSYKIYFFKIIVFDDILKHASLMFFVCVVLVLFISILLRFLSLSNVHIEFIDFIASTYNKTFHKSEKHYQYILGVLRGAIKLILYITSLTAIMLSPSMLPSQENFGICVRVEGGDFKYKRKEPIYRTTNLTILKALPQEKHIGIKPNESSDVGGSITKNADGNEENNNNSGVRMFFHRTFKIISDWINSIKDINSYSIVSNNRIISFGGEDECDEYKEKDDEENDKYINILEEFSKCDIDESRVLYRSVFYFNKNEPVIHDDFKKNIIKNKESVINEKHKPWRASLVRGVNDNSSVTIQTPKETTEYKLMPFNYNEDDGIVKENEGVINRVSNEFTDILIKEINSNDIKYNLKLFVVGFTDHGGSSLSNLSLSDRRIEFAESVLGISCYMDSIIDCRKVKNIVKKTSYYPIPFSEISYLRLNPSNKDSQDEINKNLRVTRVLLCK